MTVITFIVLRRMRAPLIAIILIYAISIVGLTLVPGVDAEGRPAPPLGFFDAFYFVSYTATTIGFGEIPTAFSYGQRMWVVLCVYLTVVGWTYAIVTVLNLLREEAFQSARTTQTFARRVRAMADPFFLVVGYGETGKLVCHALDHLGIALVVIDERAERIDETKLQDFGRDVPALMADAGNPEVLLMAGLQHHHCLGVVAITDADSTNLAVAMSVRLLNDRIPVLCRTQSKEIAANMASFGTDHIINPFEKFAEYLALAIRSPGSYQLLEWLTGIPGTELKPQAEPPQGHWVVAGFGRFGTAVAGQLDQHGMDLTIIDPDYEQVKAHPCVPGLGTEAGTLRAAGIDRAVGIVAASDNDVNNLSIAVTAKELNPKLFVVLRRNLQSNRILFEAFRADLEMVPSEIVAHECLAVLTTPLLARFLAIVKQQDDAWADAVVEHLKQCAGTLVPATWTVELNAKSAPAVAWHLRRRQLSLARLMRNPGNREEWLDCRPLLLVRLGGEILLPEPTTHITTRDRILFAGTSQAASLQGLVLSNRNAADYVLRGRETSGAWIWEWLRERRDKLGD
ncbi:MAG: potassium channel protein [Burkholderiales bacterium]|nr:potassium channel protein [Burkholderiales bacterium]